MDEFPKLVFCMPDNVSQIFPLKTHTESILFPESNWRWMSLTLRV